MTYNIYEAFNADMEKNWNEDVEIGFEVKKETTKEALFESYGVTKFNLAYNEDTKSLKGHIEGIEINFPVKHVSKESEDYTMGTANKYRFFGNDLVFEIEVLVPDELYMSDDDDTVPLE